MCVCVCVCVCVCTEKAAKLRDSSRSPSPSRSRTPRPASPRPSLQLPAWEFDLKGVPFPLRIVTDTIAGTAVVLAVLSAVFTSDAYSLRTNLTGRGEAIRAVSVFVCVCVFLRACVCVCVRACVPSRHCICKVQALLGRRR